MKKSGYNKKYGKGFASATKKKLGTIPDFEENYNFTKIYAELEELCDFIENKRPDGITTEKYTKIIQSLKNYILIRLVNVMELQLQTETVFLIDHFKLKPVDILRKEQLEISLRDLDLFRQEATTDGKIVTQEFKFANIYGINSIFSSINDLGFFALLEDLYRLSIEKELGYILKLRNDVVHNLIDVEWKHVEFEANIKKVRTYSNMFFIVSWINLDIQLINSKGIGNICKEKTGKTIDEFKKLIEKYEY